MRSLFRKVICPAVYAGRYRVEDSNGLVVHCNGLVAWENFHPTPGMPAIAAYEWDSRNRVYVFRRWVA